MAQWVKNMPAMQELQETLRFDIWVEKIPRRRAWQPTPVFLPRESHGQRSLAGYCPWGRKESNMACDTTRQEGFIGEREHWELDSLGRASWRRWYQTGQSMVVKPTHPPLGTLLRPPFPLRVDDDAITTAAIITIIIC